MSSVDLEKRRPNIRLELNGIGVFSRYSDPAEVEVMMRAIMVLPAALQAQIASVYCDSKATRSYAVTLRGVVPVGEFECIAYRIDAAFIAASGGHNGVVVQYDDFSVHRDPDWRGLVKPGGDGDY